MSNATGQLIEDVANKVDEAALGTFASGVDTSADYPLQVEGLEKSFGDTTTVDSTTFEVESGMFTGLIGPNGAGKSATLDFITGMLKPDAGVVTFNGGDITGEEPHQITNHGTVRTFQIARKLNEITVLENMMLAPKHQCGEALWRSVIPGVCDDVREQEAELLERIWEVLDFFDIAHIVEEYADNLSGGRRKLLEMAQAPLTDPDTLLLDEPFAGVNLTLEKKLLEHVRRLREQGYTFLLVKHDMDLIMNNCEHIIVLHQGSVLTRGTPDEIQSNEEAIKAYLGGNV